MPVFINRSQVWDRSWISFSFINFVSINENDIPRTQTWEQFISGFNAGTGPPSFVDNFTVVLRPVVAQGHKCVCKCDRLWVRFPRGNKIFIIIISLPLCRDKARHAQMPPEFSLKWGTECLNTRFPLPTLVRAGYSVKLIYNLRTFWYSTPLINSNKVPYTCKSDSMLV